MSYTLINVFEELSSDKITIIVLHGYGEVVSPGAEAVTVASFISCMPAECTKSPSHPWHERRLSSGDL